ncbi:MAG TPA: hypothetical protein VNT01_04205 [Symbiobacteriaceae bacterium]|nr:hypothetical protein [Symbiobacteriaceae bacterium]
MTGAIVVVQEFTLNGASQHWQGESVFTYFARGPSPGPPPPLAYPGNGYEFGQNLTYVGPPAHLRWYRVEPFFPAAVPFRRGSCTVDSGGPLAGVAPTRIEPGRHLNHGRCVLGPLDHDLAPERVGLHLVVTWEDDQGVHSEDIAMH